MRMSQMYPTSPYIHALSSVMCHVSVMESYHTLSYSHIERVIHTLSTELSSRREGRDEHITRCIILIIKMIIYTYYSLLNTVIVNVIDLTTQIQIITHLYR